MVTNLYSDQQGSKSRQNPCQVQPTENIGNLPASRRCLWVRTTVSTVWSAASISESELQATEKEDCLMCCPSTTSSKVMQKVSSSLLFVSLKMSLFQVFLYHYRFSLISSMESTSFVFPLPDGVFCLVTTGWIFDIRLCENSINQIKRRQVMRHFTSNGTYQCQNGSSNPLTPCREQPRSTRIVVAYRRPSGLVGNLAHLLVRKS